ncbi:unnamed protein product [Sphacelaria rigidula]
MVHTRVGSSQSAGREMQAAPSHELLLLKLRTAQQYGDGKSSEWKSRLSSALLHAAVMKGDVGVVSGLLKQGGRSAINSRDEVGLTPLHRAVLSTKGIGREAVVQALCQSGPNLEAAFEGLRPLHMAAGRGDHTVLRVLLEQGADKESLTADGLSALHCAAAQGALSCVRLLLEANADPHARSAGMGKRTLLHAAAVRGHPEIIVVTAAQM